MCTPLSRANHQTKQSLDYCTRNTEKRIVSFKCMAELIFLMNSTCCFVSYSIQTGFIPFGMDTATILKRFNSIKACLTLASIQYQDEQDQIQGEKMSAMIFGVYYYLSHYTIVVVVKCLHVLMELSYIKMASHCNCRSNVTTSQFNVYGL